MNKKNCILLTGLFTALFLAGCGNTASEKNAPADTEAQGKMITGYLIEHADQYVTLGNYAKLEVEQPVYSATDDEIEMSIENLVYDYSTLEDLDRPAQSGDIVVMDITGKIQGGSEPDISEKEFPFELGYEEFGAEFDEQLTGCRPGDQKTFSSRFDEDSWYEDWAGQTMDFEITVHKVQETVIPECDDDFIKNTLGYDSREDLETNVRADLEAGYAEQSLSETKENVIQSVMDTCEFDGYPDKLYDSCKASVRGGYASFAETFGMSVEELYESYGITEEDIEEEILDMVNRRLFISAVCETENLQVTDDEYDAFLSEQADSMGYEDPAELADEYDKEELMWTLYEDKAAAVLMEQVELYEIPYSSDDGMDFDDIYTDEDVEELQGFDEGFDEGLDEGGDDDVEPSTDVWEEN